MPSIRQVAEQAGVSIATVSRVLNGRASVKPELRERVLRVAGSCDYVASVGKRTAERVALVYLGGFWIGSPYDSACIEGLGLAMRNSTYDLTVLDLQRDRQEGESFKRFLARKGVCGVVVRSTIESRTEVLDIASEGVPVVVLGDHFDAEGVRFAYADSRAASVEAVEHLVALGHQRIGFVGCDRDDGDHIDRLNAYRAVLTRAGIYREQDVHKIPPARMDGAPLARRLLSRQDRPTALFIADPLIAVGVVNEMQYMGFRVPDDLSVVGLDDADTRNSVFPRMTAVCQDTVQIGRRAFDMVRALVEGTADEPPPPQQAWFEIHDSTAPPPSEVVTFTPTLRRR